MNANKIKAYCMKRDRAIIAAVRDGDLAQLRKLSQDQTGRTPSDDVILCAAHKMCLAVTTMPDELKRQSAKWLDEHGYDRSCY